MNVIISELLSPLFPPFSLFCFTYFLPTLLLSHLSPSPLPAPCCPPCVRTMAARWCGPRPHPAPPHLRASTGRYAATLPPSVGAAWVPTPPTITLSMTSGWSNTEKCPSSVGFAPAGVPCPWLPATLTPQSRWFAGGEDLWTIAMSSWPTRHTSCTTHHRPEGNSGSKYSSLFTVYS